MKKAIFLLAAALLLMSFSSNSQKKSSGDHSSGTKSITYQVKSPYILLPVEENAPEVKMNVCVPAAGFNETYDVRLAQVKIDYWVPLKVEKFQGKELILNLTNCAGAEMGIDAMKESDKFDLAYDETYRPRFHFTPEYGWMNDPNGMVYLDGEYHLFFQYNPYGAVWGNMHWGHAVSTDLVSWTYLPTAIAPDTLGAIFSGSAVIDVNNTAGFGKNAMVAIFTSAGKVQAQSIAYSTDKGRTFTKYAHNPVLPNPGITDFRDPKVSWNETSHQWIMTLATKQTITFFGSPNLKEWTKLSEFGAGMGSHAGVWECPDLFPLTYKGKTKWVLLVNINPGGPNGGSSTQYFIGSFDGTKFTADPLPYPLWIDYGRDNYAGVTWSNIPKADGRRLFLGWMSNWDYANQVPTKNFRSANTVPRELSLVSNGKHLILKSSPAKELKTLRGASKTFPNQLVDKSYSIAGLLPKNKGTYEIEMTLKPGHSTRFGFELKNSKAESLKFTFDLQTNTLSVDREKSGIIGFKDNFKSGATAPLTKNAAYKVRLLVDKASSELFINDGEIVMSTILFPTEVMNSMNIFSAEDNLSAENITIYNIK
jgi:fructan beta-fructosidase